MKQEQWEGAYRAAGKGPLGIHYGKPVYTLVAAESRKKALAEFTEDVWIEVYKEGVWKKLM
jgi:hypothetical protein